MRDRPRRPDLLAILGPRRGARWPLAIVLLLGLAGAIGPLWIGPLPPLEGLIAETIRADAWSRIGVDPTIDAIVAPAARGLGGDTFATRAIGLLTPGLGAVASVRLFTSLGLLAMVLSFLGFLRSQRRSPWLVCLALPLAWGALITSHPTHPWGLACTFWVAALASAAASHGHLARLGALTCAALVACVVAPYEAPIGLVAAVWLAIAQRPTARRLLGVAIALTPAVLVLAVTGAAGGAGGGTVEPLAALNAVLSGAHDLTAPRAEGIILALVLGLWVVLLVNSRPERAGTPVLWLTLGLVLLYIAMPPAGGYTDAPARMTALLCLLALPRVATERLATRAALGGAAVLTLWAGYNQARAALAFELDELAPLAEAVDAIPAGARAACIGTDVAVRFRGRPLNLACAALLQTRRGTIAPGARPALSDADALDLLTDDAIPAPPPADHWDDHGGLDVFDALIVRGDHAAPGEDRARALVAARRDRPSAALWTAYELVRIPVAPSAYEITFGGVGGRPLLWDCPLGTALAGMVVTTTRDGRLVGSMQPRCRGLQRQANVIQYRGRTVLGPRFGAKRQYRRKTLTCRRGELVTGIYGRNSSIVHALGLLCAKVEIVVGADDDLSPIERERFEDRDPSATNGSEEGEAFGAPCPEGTVVTGLRGRFGAALDAAGIACADLATVVEASKAQRAIPPPTPTTPKAPAPTGAPTGPPALPDAAPRDGMPPTGAPTVRPLPRPQPRSPNGP